MLGVDLPPKNLLENKSRKQSSNYEIMPENLRAVELFLLSCRLWHYLPDGRLAGLIRSELVTMARDILALPQWNETVQDVILMESEIVTAQPLPKRSSNGIAR